MSERPGLFGRNPTVYTIPAESAFVDALAQGILDEVGDDPAALVAVTVLLPTRRACRSLADAFLRRSDGKALLLPRLTPLGDIDEDDLAFAAWDSPLLGEVAGDGADVPPAIPGLRRQLLLTRLILAEKKAWNATPDQAAALAIELGRLLDQVQTERLGFDGLARLVPDRKEYSEHWQITLDFLKLLTENWPAILAEEGAIDSADRRNRLLQAQADAWRRHPPGTPVIAAGSTGSIPATADLLSVVARLPRGAVVLPGLDRAMNDTAWNALGPTHPQYGLARLLAHLEVPRGDVAPWPGPAPEDRLAERMTLVNRALLPATAIQSWPTDAAPTDRALDGLQLVECPGPQEEAGVIALAMREAIETPGRTAALVTPDRGLARRVAAELARWNIEIDDSAGLPLDQTPTGTFLRLVSRMVADDMAPVPLLACLKHPLAGLGLAPGVCRALVRQLEIATLRGPRPEPGVAGLRAALGGKRPAVDRLLEALDDATRPFVALMKKKSAALPDLLRAHVAAAEALAATDGESGPDRLWAGDGGEAAAAFVADLDGAGDVLDLDGKFYPALFDGLMAGGVVRPRYGRHPRLFIWGLLEARLQRTDLVILGGLNEGSWPPETKASPWMSRPMMMDFGLPLPERRIGLTAHDFTQAVAASRVMLTRATRVEGTPTVPSRWLSRLKAMLQTSALASVFEGRHSWLHWQGSLDAATAAVAVEPPAPRPPVAARPRRLSVTQIETWMRNPYAIYARHILRLKPLPAIDADPGASDYGSFIHQALHDFIQTHPSGRLPEDALDRLLAKGKEAFGKALDRPGIRAFWWPRFERIADWFIEVERDRRLLLATSVSEVAGSLAFDAPAGRFELTAKADRIDTFKDGGIAIVDYKTGKPPTDKEVAAGYAPQLPLEGAIVAAGGFAKVAKGKPSDLGYWQLSGRDPAGDRRSIKAEASTLIAEALAGLEGLVAAFDREETPYRARPRPDKAPVYDDYEHLARVREWASTDGEDGP